MCFWQCLPPWKQLNLEDLSASSQEITQITSSSSRGEFSSSAESQLDPTHLLWSPVSLWAHWCALPPSTSSPSTQPSLLNFLLSQPPGVFMAELIHNSPDRLVQVSVLCPGVSTTSTLISPVTHPFHAAERDSQSVSPHITFPPASCSSEFLGKKKYLEMLSCCPSTLAVVMWMLQHSGSVLPAAWHWKPSLPCKWEQQEGWPCSRREGWPCPPTFSPSEVTGTHPRINKTGSYCGLFLLEDLGSLLSSTLWLTLKK